MERREGESTTSNNVQHAPCTAQTNRISSSREHTTMRGSMGGAHTCRCGKYGPGQKKGDAQNQTKTPQLGVAMIISLPSHPQNSNREGIPVEFGQNPNHNFTPQTREAWAQRVHFFVWLAGGVCSRGEVGEEKATQTNLRQEIGC